MHRTEAENYWANKILLASIPSIAHERTLGASDLSAGECAVAKHLSAARSIRRIGKATAVMNAGVVNPPPVRT